MGIKVFGTPLSESAVLKNVDDVAGPRDVKKVLDKAEKLPLASVMAITSKLETAVNTRFPAKNKDRTINNIREFRITAMKR